MKILYHHRTQAKCAEGIHIRGITEAFRELGHQVDILSPPGVQVSTAEISDQVLGENGRTTKGMLSRIADTLPESAFEVLELLYNLYSFLSLYKILSRRTYDLIYERYSLFGISSLILSKVYKVPLILEVNDATVIQRSRPLSLKNIARFFEKRVLRNADVIITISNHLKKLLLSHGGICPEKVMVLPNAIDPKRFENGRREIDIRKVLTIDNRYIIGVVGAFVPWHGLAFLLESLQTVCREYDIHLLLVGDGPVRKEIETLATKLDLAKHVTMTGFVNSHLIPNFIAGMDICLMPNSNPHGSPIKIVEYMAMGKPVVAPKYQPIEEIIENGITGILFPPLNSREFKQSIVALLLDQALRERLGQNARQKVMAEFKWIDNVTKVLDRLSTLQHGS